ncbi:LysE family translocator [Collimonas sp.]|jgi:threonine/homoserine/homoserine lactone efflux protein|uniref:LysE family translocator n=1 Tax=Collimonas sp. TaxID=1963772 RepID=UPI002BB589CE|nr:LysE family translocator [Collimonas sp.]HWX02216.1 LysE family translocator [Collimonas sp.]
MPEIWLFLIAAMTLTLAPGPDNIYVLTRGIAQGRKAGLVSALGFSSGLIFHTMLAVLGFAALIKASPLAYSLLRYAGAGYLIYIGVRTLRSHATVKLNGNDAAPPMKLSRIYWQSVIANILNPKVTLFFIAFLPQFVNAGAGHIPAQMLLLAAVFILQALLIFSAVALFSGMVGAFFQRKKAAASVMNRVAGTAFIGLGIRIALPQ